MSLFPTQFQIISDIHLETPKSKPTYTHFSKAANFPTKASNLCLLGDIGLVNQEEQLFAFLTSLLDRTPNLKIYYVLGNHEPYETTLEYAVSALERFETESRRRYSDRFYFMNRRRIDMCNISILGCTLWSNISTQAQRCSTTLTDFHDTHGIKVNDPEVGMRARTVADHNKDHATDLAWLNDRVTNIEAEDSRREILILTHHSPTMDPRANNPVHAESNVREGFRTDLSEEICWRSKQVRLWAFGHTHYSCAFQDLEGDGASKLVVANQKGYTRHQELNGTFQLVGYSMRILVVTADKPWTFEWGHEVPASESAANQSTQREQEPAAASKPKVRVRGALGRLLKLGKGSRDA
ncbi:Metallo-dependent phosphatase-like protein [Lophiotrema nucula]|uniref:Metallo-dependent phosphatase-like protein n=1 Tax=Lophiotrema nucula TaxID=690887 RepID=A0A6A5ZK49_9PLEO|nr:Metallo-dependent phosphatase-like protein [Lophiotrema nucula]